MISVCSRLDDFGILCDRQEHIDSVLETLLKGTRRVPEFEISIMDEVKPLARRPKTARLALNPTREQLNRAIDLFSGIDQHDNSRLSHNCLVFPLPSLSLPLSSPLLLFLLL
jgi:hypothetical protein